MKETIQFDTATWPIGCRTNVVDRDIESEIMLIADDLGRLNDAPPPMGMNGVTKATNMFKKRMTAEVVRHIYADDKLPPKKFVDAVDGNQQVREIKSAE